MYLDNNGRINVLQDPKQDGKERPWREKKIRSLIISQSFERLGESQRSGRIQACGTYLEFTKEIESGRQFLSSANFCRERLCPMCQWRRSLKVFYEVSQVMDIMETHKNLVPIFLTVTIKNVPGDMLNETLDKMFKGWYAFSKIRKLKNVMKGWFRALEITCNLDFTFHPHIHAIIFVDDESYFKDYYIKTAEWVQLWKVAMHLDYDPICDVRKIKNDKRKTIAEVSKYTLKDLEFATKDTVLTDRFVSLLSKTLKGRRLYAYGGLMKEAAAFISNTAPDEGDLVHVGDDTIRGDVATVITRYHWDFVTKLYTKTEVPDLEKIAATALAEGP